MTARYRTVALLPMKANSERVRGKNFRDLGGKPLFRWILDALLDSDCIDVVVINTDAREILERHGVTESKRVIIRDRKPEICGDFVSMNDVLSDDVESIEAENYVMTHTTNPLITSATIREALVTYRAGSGDSLFSVNKVQTRFYRKDGTAVNHDPKRLVRTQDLEPWFEENSCLYIFSRSSFRNTGARIGATPIMFETPPLESLDIDEPHDWELVSAVVAKLMR